jgi:hypothetical protein
LKNELELKAPQAVPAWLPIESAPKDGTFFLAWYCKHQLDDEGNPTDEVIGGEQAIVSCAGNQWDEPEWLSAHGASFLDDYCFAEMPTCWMPLPAAPKGAV